MVAGFGFTSVTVGFNHTTQEFYFKDGTWDDKLHYAETDVISNSECNRVFTGINFDNNYLCARLKQRDPNNPRGTCLVR